MSGLSPAFDPQGKSYDVAVADGVCLVPVTATLADPSLSLYVQSTPVPSGQTWNAWVCDGADKISLVVYQGWTEVGRTTLTKKLAPSIPPPAAQSPLAALSIPGLSPAYSAAVTSYTIPKPASGTALVTATLGAPGLSLYIQSNPVKSGVATNVWTGSGKISVVVYKSWTEVARATVTLR